MSQFWGQEPGCDLAGFFWVRCLRSPRPAIRWTWEQRPPAQPSPKTAAPVSTVIPACGRPWAGLSQLPIPTGNETTEFRINLHLNSDYCVITDFLLSLGENLLSTVTSQVGIPFYGRVSSWVAWERRDSFFLLLVGCNHLDQHGRVCSWCWRVELRVYFHTETLSHKWWLESWARVICETHCKSRRPCGPAHHHLLIQRHGHDEMGPVPQMSIL